MSVSVQDEVIINLRDRLQLERQAAASCAETFYGLLSSVKQPSAWWMDAGTTLALAGPPSMRCFQVGVRGQTHDTSTVLGSHVRL